MSSLSTLGLSFRLNTARLAVVAGFAGLLVVLGFLFPLWIVLLIAAMAAAFARMVRAVRIASMKIEQILDEELPPDGVER